MLPDPAESGFARERFLEYWRAVDEYAVAKLASMLGDRGGELLQLPAQHLVIVAAECVPSDIADRRIRERGTRIARAVRPIAHAGRDHSNGAWHQLSRPGALAAVPFHVAHRPVAAKGEPAIEAPLIGLEVSGGDTELREPEVEPDPFD